MQDYKELFAKVRDLFGEVFVGGSFAVDTILGNSINPDSDIDFFIKYNPCTRYMTKDVIEHVLFKGYDVRFLGSSNGNNSYYKMPGLRRRIRTEVIMQGEVKAYDFMFIQDLDAEYLLSNQASTATMCCLSLNFSDVGYREHTNKKFVDTHKNKQININIDPGWCTVSHAGKIYKKYADYSIYPYSTPRVVAQ